MKTNRMTTNWNMTTRVAIISIILVLAGLFINAIRPLIGPMIAAALLAYSLHPLVRRLELRTRWRHNWAFALVYFPFLAILIAAPGMLAPLLVRQIQTLSNEFLLTRVRANYCRYPIRVGGLF